MVNFVRYDNGIMVRFKKEKTPYFLDSSWSVYKNKWLVGGVVYNILLIVVKAKWLVHGSLLYLFFYYIYVRLKFSV